ncbi:BLUF domain-containing protein [Acinetobacter pseudolwoffii]|uniref:BLUF domain-containing protein n=1 Tax=Acinetobacter pseudolwoffii TaxID=2053287 RepID=UPI000C243DB5|nr:BLUF domain-containing protein [Acinetobacter pseudolwoffii]PJI29806.1 blue light sensor protein [Acinetobacter pseudolwoffii]
MYQFCYASKSTSSKVDLLEDLTNILKEARDFNHRYQVTGVLYFADGYFFQCLEGECLTLKSLLLERLNKDPRHHDIKLFETKEIEYPSFPDWSMKYISKRSQIQKFCQDMGFNDFNPFAFQQHHVDALLEKLSLEQAEEQKSA